MRVRLGACVWVAVARERERGVARWSESQSSCGRRPEVVRLGAQDRLLSLPHSLCLHPGEGGSVCASLPRFLCYSHPRAAPSTSRPPSVVQQETFSCYIFVLFPLSGAEIHVF